MLQITAFRHPILHKLRNLDESLRIVLHLSSTYPNAAPYSKTSFAGPKISLNAVHNSEYYKQYSNHNVAYGNKPCTFQVLYIHHGDNLNVDNGDGAKHISKNVYPIIYSGWLNTILNNLKLLVQNLGRESWSVMSCKCAKLSKGQGRRTHSPPVHFFKWRKSKERFQEEPSLFLIDVTRGVRGGELKKKKNEILTRTRQCNPSGFENWCQD